MNRYGQLCYTYLIGWRELDLWYYGSRSGNKVNPKEDLLLEYFTSSKGVKEQIMNTGLPDVVKVHKTFRSKKEAEEFEGRFLRKVSAKDSPRWLNRSNNSFPCVSFPRSDEWKDKLRTKALLRGSQPFTEEVRRKMSESHIGIPSPNKGATLTPEWKAKISESNKGKHTGNRSRTGKPHSEETKRKMSASNKGKNIGKTFKHSEDTKLKISLARKAYWATRKSE